LISDGDELFCSVCDRRYPIVDGIPILSGLAGDEPAADYKRHQIEFFDGEAAEFEITRSRGHARFYGWLMTEKSRRSVRGLESRLPGATVLAVCGGSGMVASTFLVGAPLPYAYCSFDMVYVHDGLHHLSDPMVSPRTIL